MALITVPTTSNTHARNKCECSDELTSIATNPDDANSTEGVSVENALEPTPQLPPLTIEEVLSPDFEQPEDYHWYFLRVNYGRAQDFYEDKKDKASGYLIYMPCQKKVQYYDGRKIESLEPIFKSNIFVYATEEQARSHTRWEKEGLHYVDFTYDHASKNKYGRNEYLTIPFNQMLNFIRAEKVHHPWAHIVSEEQVHYRPGGLVRVTDGTFKGVEGRIARVFGQTRVVIEIERVGLYATPYISPKFIKPKGDLSTAYVSQRKLVPIEDNKNEDLAGNSISRRLERHEVKVMPYRHDEKFARKRKAKRYKH